MRTLLLVSCLLGITACTTTPYTRYKSPDISGQITIDNQPATSVAVYLSISGGDDVCAHDVNHVYTDEQGFFFLESVKEHMDYTPLMTHYLDEWVLCADIKNVRRKLIDGNRYGMGSVTQKLNLQCAFDSQSANTEPCRPVLGE
jgi:hypothetical protein